MDARYVVVDPAGLFGHTKEYAEEPVAEFGGIRPMANRNDDAVVRGLSAWPA